ncbi:hypothetical protein HO173_003434 [Letharia columbiana]|uniref:Uncharacterized protein n=1 Tax=Letharia columbiana TaxID=112416 RepID=A0A8H6L7F9_9LECA|nr:uncharacterized protein HO173_003434 [Letharia columbiana]KAF6238466.1 hypothetical protein HO173_003434 [Letharia columbiana]
MRAIFQIGGYSGLIGEDFVCQQKPSFYAKAAVEARQLWTLLSTKDGRARLKYVALRGAVAGLVWHPRILRAQV